MEKILAYTGYGAKSVPWPHPHDEKINDIFAKTSLIYGIGSLSEVDFLLRCEQFIYENTREYIKRRKTYKEEEHFKLAEAQVVHGFDLDTDERRNLISKCNLVVCAGNWKRDPDAVSQYNLAVELKKPVIHLIHNPTIPIEKIIRYFVPIEPIPSDTWDDSKKDDIVVFENSDGMYDLCDGNHRHQLATKVGGVPTLSGWIMKVL